jgi:putative transposase
MPSELFFNSAALDVFVAFQLVDSTGMVVFRLCGLYSSAMSRLRRLVLADRYFFVTCNLLRRRRLLSDSDFEILARVFDVRRAERGFFLTAWVFLPDHWHAVMGVRYPRTISLVVESIKVASTRQMNTLQKESGRLWQGRFFDRALRTVKEYNETVEYIHWNPVRRGLAARPEEWKWSSAHEYGFENMAGAQHNPPLRIDRVRIPVDEKARI